MANNGEASPSFIHDVFLSFRGEDTRHSFTGNLRHALCRKGINTFMDDEKLRRGEEISPALCKAIEESRISIIVFSEKYASSTWCLRELVKILDCMKKKRQLVLPIFYKVDPSDVRHQSNLYGKFMTAHENEFGKDSEKVQEWRSALSEVANLKGDHFTTGYEYEFIEKIVKEVSVKLPPKPLLISEHLVGLEPRVEEVRSRLDIKSNDDDPVCMLGIYGVGGIGKTALAKALYNKIAHQFEATSFLSDVREKSNKINGLEDLQKTLLSEMLEELETELGSTGKGTYEIKRKLGWKKVLLVLDDVDDKEQLEELAGGCDWFGSGSRIIITTREKDLLTAHQVQNVYEMTELNDQDSLELLCWNAFKMSHPETNFDDVSSRTVGYAKGLPLALKVIGSNLIHKSLEAWECALEEYERIPDKKIQNVLKRSYDSLGDNAKSVFLDIACFFKGERVEYVTKILDACDFGATLHIGVLVDKSLVTVECGWLKMHDLIQDMGREIVRQEARTHGKRSRLWFYEDVLRVLTENSGSSKIEGIMLDPPQREEVDWNGTAFENMTSLRILIVRNTSFSSGPKYLPNHLKLLEWEEFPSKSFPPGFYPKKIIVFNICKSHLTLEEQFKKFSCLTYMNFSYSQSITEMPDVSEVQNLRELRLDNCKKLIKVHESVGLLKKLVHLSASECSKLRNFLPRMFLPSLETLDLNLCVRLEHFPDIVGKMNKPLKIYMINTAIKELPHSIGNLTGLDCLEIPSSKRLRDLPSSLFTLPNFAAFKIGGCSQLRESFRMFLENHSVANDDNPSLRTLYFGIGGLSDEDLHAILNCFPKLEDLNASENNFVSLPTCIKESVYLTSLDVSSCTKLQKIPECTNLRILDVNRCVKLQDISELPSTIQKVDARYCLSLTRETSTMLWSQVLKEINRLEVVMPQTEIPEWFDFSGKGGTPRFWARRKFPIVALALVLEDVNEMVKSSMPVRRQLVDLHLFINGQSVPRKGYYNFRIAEDHVLLCDLRVLFSDEEWLGLDAFLEHDWNYVQVSYEVASNLTLSCWGVYVYKQQTNMEDVEFMCPDPKYSDIANMSSTLVPKRDHKQGLMKMIDGMCLEEMFNGMLMETMDVEERNDFVDKNFAIEQLHILMGGLKEISMQAKAALESNRPSEKASGYGCGECSELYDKHSTLGCLLRTIQEMDQKDQAKEEASISGYGGSSVVEQDNEDYRKLKAPMVERDCGWTREEASSSEVQGSDPQQQEIMMRIFLDGMIHGLVEAKLSFPTLDIGTTINAALNKGNQVSWSRPGIENNNDLPPAPVEMNIYVEGMINGLLEAQLSFPTLDIETTINTALSRANEGPSGAPMVQGELDWTTDKEASSSVIQYDHPLRQENLILGSESMNVAHGKLNTPVVLEDDDTLLQALMMMRRESLESEVKSKLYWKLKVGHKALRKKFEEFEKEAAALEKDTANFSSLKNQYDELLEKFNSQSVEFVSMKHQRDRLGRELSLASSDAQTKASKISELKFALNSTGMHTEIREKGAKGVTKYEKLVTIWKGRAEELQRLYDVGIEGFKNSEEFEDLISAIYLDGLRDGLLEAQVSFLALDMERMTAVFKENEVLDFMAHVIV